MTGKERLVVLEVAAGGAVAAALLWFSFVVFGVRRPEAGPPAAWPLAAGWFAVAAGAVAGAAAGAFGVARARKHSRNLATLCDLLEYTFEEEATGTAWEPPRVLPRFSRWTEAGNHVAGTAAGIPFDMIDHERLVPGGEGYDRWRETVSLVRFEDPAFPAFELQPDAPFLGPPATSSRVVASLEPVPPHDPFAAVARRFDRSYVLSACEPAGGDRTGDRVAAARAFAEQVRPVLSRELIALLVAGRRWHLQSAGGWLAAWRSGTVVPAAERPTFLAGVLELRAALESARNAPLDAADRPRLGVAKAAQAARQERFGEAFAAWCFALFGAAFAAAGAWSLWVGAPLWLCGPFIAIGVALNLGARGVARLFSRS